MSQPVVYGNHLSHIGRWMIPVCCLLRHAPKKVIFFFPLHLRREWSSCSYSGTCCRFRCHHSVRLHHPAVLLFQEVSFTLESTRYVCVSLTHHCVAISLSGTEILFGPTFRILLSYLSTWWTETASWGYSILQGELKTVSLAFPTALHSSHSVSQTPGGNLYSLVPERICPLQIDTPT